MQEKHCLVAEVSQRIDDLKENFAHMKTRRGKNLRKYERQSATGMYMGVQITQDQRRGNSEQDYVAAVDRDIDDLLDGSVFFLENRFLKYLDSKPHSLFNVFNYNRWPSKDEDEDQFRKYGDDIIESLVEHYRPLLSQEEQESASDQWLNLKLQVNRLKKRSILETYETVMGSDPSCEEFKSIQNIIPIVNVMLTISPSTAECERGFSTMNRIKTQSRTSMSQSTLQNLIRISVDGPSMQDFSATKSIIHWMDSSKGTRHVKGHKLPSPKPKPKVYCISDSDSDD